MIIEVDNGSVDPLDEVRAWAAEEKIPYPVLYDAAGEACARYGVRSYPSRYLLDRSGAVVWEDCGWSAAVPAAVEKQIRKALNRG